MGHTGQDEHVAAPAGSSDHHVRVVVFASSPVARAGWRTLLAGQVTAAVAIVAEADTTTALVAQVAATRPDVVLADQATADELVLPVLHSLRGAYPGLRVVVLGDQRADAVLDAISTGVHAYLRLAATADEVAAAILAVQRGLIVLDAPSAGPLLDRVTGATTVPVAPPATVPRLTARELEVLQLLAAGLTNRGIARQLRISEHTAKFHVGGLLAKMNVASRAEAVAIAARAGLLLH